MEQRKQGRPPKEIKLYNSEVKERFFKNKSFLPNTILTYSLILNKFTKYEKKYGKDLFAFTPEELADALKAYNCKTIDTVSTVKSILKTYCEWALSENYIPSNINPADFFTAIDTELSISKIAISNQYLYDEQEYYDLVEFCQNYQDKGLIIVLYRGIKGLEFEEIRNLKKGDIYSETNTVMLTRDNNEKRLLTLQSIKTSETMAIDEVEILLEAATENAYLKYKDESYKYGLKKMKNDYYYLGSNDYVFRSKTGLNERIRPAVISQRVKKIAEFFGKPFLNPTNIVYSGIFHQLERIEAERPLTTEDYIRFNSIAGLTSERAPFMKRRYLQYKKYKQSK